VKLGLSSLKECTILQLAGIISVKKMSSPRAIISKRERENDTTISDSDDFERIGDLGITKKPKGAAYDDISFSKRTPAPSLIRNRNSETDFQNGAVTVLKSDIDELAHVRSTTSFIALKDIVEVEAFTKAGS